MIVAVVLTAFGMALISAAFVVPPLGVIHQSVLAVTGEIFSLVGALLIFDYRYRKFNQDKNVYKDENHNFVDYALFGGDAGR
jgi:hypothetical protein